MKTKPRILLRLFAVMGSLLLMLTGCPPEQEVDPPSLTTAEVIGITSNWAISGGVITNDGGADITERGVCWSTTNPPSISDQTFKSGTGTGDFTCNFKGLTGNTTYYLSAYASNKDATGYGNVTSFTTPPTVTDVDGNVYATVVIGTQTWMAENLRVIHYSNGDPVTKETDFEQWLTQETGFYTDYENDENLGDTYGHLYNWFVVQDSRLIAPEGWHVPTYDEWVTLIDYLGGVAVAGEKLREAGYSHWVKEVGGFSFPQGTNISGFTAIAGGYLNPTGEFFGDLKWFAAFWSSTDLSERYTYQLMIDKANEVFLVQTDKNLGYSIRCVKD